MDAHMDTVDAAGVELVTSGPAANVAAAIETAQALKGVLDAVTRSGERGAA